MNPRTARAIFLSLYWDLQNRGSMWIVWVVAGLITFLPIIPLFPFTTSVEVLSLHGAIQRVVEVFVGVTAAGATLGLSHLLLNSLRQCSPQNRHLCPGLRKTAVAMFGIAWLTVTLLLSAIGAASNGHFILYFLGIGSLLLLVPVSFAPNAGWFLGMPIYLNGFYRAELQAVLQDSGLMDGALLPSLLCTSALLLLYVFCMIRTYGVAGDRAFIVQRATQRKEQMIKTSGLRKSPVGIEKLFSPQWLYDIALRQAVAANGDIGNKAKRLLRFGLGYGMHWSFCITAMLTFAGLFFLATLAGFIIALPGLGHTVALNVGIVALAMFPGMALTNLKNSMRQTRHEQALLRLVPAVPAPSHINRTIAKFALAQCIAALACGGFLCLVSYCFLLSHAPEIAIKLRSLAVCGILTGLPLIAFSLADYSAMAKSVTYTGVREILATISLGGLLVLARYQAPTVVFWMLCIAVAIISVSLARGRWHMAINAPVALPACRNGT